MERTALITGINGGIGRATAQKFDHEGYRVIGTDINSEENDACDRLYHVDVEDSDELLDFCQQFRKEESSLDGLINNAAIQIRKEIVEMEVEEWDAIMETNIRPAFLLARELVPLMERNEGGAIANISSIHARITSVGLSAYASSKGALTALTRAMALEFAKKEIRVNAVLPGAIDTEMLEEGLSRAKRYQEAKKNLIEGTPLKKIGDPEEVANLIYFLCDPEQSSNITGQEFVCDGGAAIQLGTEHFTT